MANDPSRIDLLELDIDLRLADLWREAVDVSDWSLEIVAAFIRAAYGGSGSLRARALEHALWGIPHLCCYTVAAARTLVRRAGFTVEDVRARPSCHDAASDEDDPAWFDLTAVAC